MPEYESTADPGGHGTEHSGFIKWGEFLDQVEDY